MNRRTFSKLLVSLLPAAWVASKVKGEVPKPEPKTLVFPSKSSFPPGFDASKGIDSIEFGTTAKSGAFVADDPAFRPIELTVTKPFPPGGVLVPPEYMDDLKHIANNYGVRPRMCLPDLTNPA